jgi:hypothetical protein
MKVRIETKKNSVPHYLVVIDLVVFILIAWFTFRWELPATYFIAGAIYLGLAERLDQIIERL